MKPHKKPFNLKPKGTANPRLCLFYFCILSKSIYFSKMPLAMGHLYQLVANCRLPLGVIPAKAGIRFFLYSESFYQEIYSQSDIIKLL